MAEVVLKDIVKIYPYIDKKQKKGAKGPKLDQSQIAATATLIAARDGRDEVTEQDIEVAKAQMSSGVDTKKKVNLQITEKGVVAVQQFNLDIKDQEFIVLVGPSGCGKSTTLRMVAGLEDITEGELFIDGRLCNAIEPKDRDIAMVFQSYALYPHMTVMENMAYPLKILPQNITYGFEIEYLTTANRNLEVEKTELKLNLDKKKAKMEESAKKRGADLKSLVTKFEKLDANLVKKFKALDEKKRANEARIAECNAQIASGETAYFAKMNPGMRRYKVMQTAEMLNITEYLNRKPRNLSGGQRQRVAIGRACVRNPKVLLMDEPLSNLDAKLRNEMRAELIKLRSKINTTFIYVTHDQTEAMTLGDRIVVMKDGFIQQIGTPQDVFDHPANLFVSGFIGTPKMNYFVADLKNENGKYSVTYGDYTVVLSEEKQKNLAAKNVQSQEVILGVRPDHMVISKEGILGKVEVSELMGTSSHLHLSIDGQDAIAIVPNNGKIVDYIGKEIRLGFNPNVVHLFSMVDEHNLEF